MCIASLWAGGNARAQQSQNGSSQDPCNLPTRDSAVVTLRFADGALAETLGTQTRQALRSTLASGVLLCRPESPAATNATARIQVVHDDSGTLQVELDDRLTDKRVTRALPLQEFPEDSRPLALAVACDELLRASWLELSLAPKPQQPRPVPPAVTAQVRADLETAQRRVRSRRSLFARGAVNWYSGGVTMAGADVGVSRRLGPRWDIAFAIGGRRGRRIRSALGKARLSGATLEAALHYTLLSGRDLNLQLLADTQGMLTYASADATTATASARAAAQPTVHLHLGATGHIRIAHGFGARWGLQVGLPVRSVSLEDSRGRLASTSGLALQVTLGLEVGR